MRIVPIRKVDFSKFYRNTLVKSMQTESFWSVKMPKNVQYVSKIKLMCRIRKQKGIIKTVSYKSVKKYTGPALQTSIFLPVTVNRKIKKPLVKLNFWRSQ